MKTVQYHSLGSSARSSGSFVTARSRGGPLGRVTLSPLEPGIDSNLANELAIAHKIQQSLLPRDLPCLPGFGLSAHCQSARHVGGDFYDILPLDRERALLVIADVMGKGVPAALFAVSLRRLVRSCAQLVQSPSELLQRINREMFDELSSVDMFITVQVVLLDTHRRRLQVASAGHCPLLVTNGFGESLAIAPNGVPLGIDPFEHYLEQNAPLPPGACALLYTDGLNEACDPEGNPFDQERLLDWLTHQAAIQRNAARLKEAFLGDLRHVNTSRQDDLTFVILAEEGPVLQPDEDAWVAKE